MKFNFEGFKKGTEKIAKKVAIGTGVILASTGAIETQGQETIKGNDLNKTEIIKNNSNKESQTIAFNEAQKNYIQGGDYHEGFHYNLDTKSLEKKSPQISDENKILFGKINDLERDFASLSKENFEILHNSISIISDNDLGQNVNKNEYMIDEKGIEITSPLNNKYIVGVLNSNIVNNMDDIKVLDKSSLSYIGIKDTKEMADDGYINLKNGDFKHYIPEYYFVLTQENNNSEAVFKLKVVSSKEQSVVREILIKEELPQGDKFKDPVFVKLVEGKIIPDIEKEIKNFLENHDK